MTFNELNIAEPILKAVCEKGYNEPTPIQEQAIPVVLRGKDIFGIAQTGTGKTAAFAIPILQMLSEDSARDERSSVIEPGASRRDRRGRSHGKKECRAIRSLILTPTRELALQIGDCFTDYGKYTGLKHTAIFGGVKQNPQTEKLRAGRGYPDRHPRTVARPDRTGRGEVRRPDAFRTGRGGQDARHGIHRRYQAAAESAAGETSNALFLGYDAQGYRRVVGVYPARSGTGGSDSRFLDGRYGRPMRLFRRETREKRPADIGAEKRVRPIGTGIFADETTARTTSRAP